MKLLLILPFILVSATTIALADEPVQQGRSVAFCSDKTPVCAFTSDGRASETDECQARRDQAVRILPGACWDAD